jgi:1-deoxy-D-xylulose-5-phosphate synthase
MPTTTRLMPTTFHEIPRQRPVTPLLDRARTPAELRRLSEAELETLADELRLDLLYTVGQTGGHFGAGSEPLRALARYIVDRRN